MVSVKMRQFGERLKAELQKEFAESINFVKNKTDTFAELYRELQAKQQSLEDRIAVIEKTIKMKMDFVKTPEKTPEKKKSSSRRKRT